MPSHLPLIAALLALTVVVGVTGVARAQGNPYVNAEWIRAATQPVITTGPPGSWNSYQVYAGPVVLVGGVYHMMYTGSSVSGAYAIGHATSTNGLTWSNDPRNPVISEGQSPAVLVEDGIFRMWFTTNSRQSVLYATSPDGSVWTLASGNPTLVAGPGWDSGEIRPGPVVHDATGYRMYYSGAVANYALQGGLATSPDGVSWSKSSFNPVMKWGLSGNWDAGYVLLSSLLVNGSTTTVWYVGSPDPHFTGWRLGVSDSPDGVNWTAASSPTFVPAAMSWDSTSIGPSSVLRVGNQLWLWYTASGSSPNFQIGVAKASVPLSGTAPSALPPLALLVMVLLVAGIAPPLALMYVLSRGSRGRRPL